MDEQAQVVDVQRRRSRAEAEQLVAEYEASGLSRVEFCRKQGLSLATLARYRKRQAQGSPASGNGWVVVEMWVAQEGGCRGRDGRIRYPLLVAGDA